MSEEPIYVRQTGDVTSASEATKWFSEAANEARAEGATWFRASVDETLRLLLLEGWRVRPLDQGEPRWALTWGAKQ